MLFVVALVLGVAAPGLALVDIAVALQALDGTVGHIVGVVLTVAGISLTLIAQLAMGDSWRIGVDEHERTRLVTDGPFALVRNPIFSAMIPTSVGLVLLVPSLVAIIGLLALIVALQLQTRAVEEPYLQRVQGRDYAAYAARVGRFVPGLGRIGD